MMSNETKKVLVIEDETHIAEGIKLNLSLQGHDVRLAPDGVEGIRDWEDWSPDLLVLDLMMPNLDGYAVIEKVRRLDEKIPILILSAKDSSVDKVKCLEMGVDDYLSKPFNLEELLLRVDRLLKRSGWNREEVKDKIEFGKNVVDLISGEADGVSGKIQLTEQELKVLKVFYENEGTPLSRQALLEKAWGYEGNVSTRTVDNFIVRFRKYFEDDAKDPYHFKSMRSRGYIFTK